MKLTLEQGDCLELMPEIVDHHFDMILCDLPYGITQCKWDTVIDLALMWEQYKRLIKPDGAIVLTASQPFTSALVMSNPKMFKYDWVWKKTRTTGFLNANRQPIRQHETILVFGAAKTYNPQGLQSHEKQNKRGKTGDNYGDAKSCYTQKFTNYPRSVLEIGSEGKTIHPTQKPVALMEYLIKTYTIEGANVLDNCMGSGTTGVACANLNRNFWGMEQDAKYFEIASQRIRDAYESR